MAQEEARRIKQPAAALETARLISLLDQSNRVLDKASADGTNLVNLRLARDEAITRLLRLNAQIAELTATQNRVIEATRQLEIELAAQNGA